MMTQELAIVVVDDQESGQRIAEIALNRAGWRDIRFADGGQQALELLTRRCADVVVADWMMPNMDGLALTARIRALDEQNNHYTSVILFTAVQGIEPLVEAFECGIDDYVNKPLDERELAARVHAAGRIATLQNALLQTSQALADRNRRLEEMATTDPLTGLGNRRFFDEQLDSMLVETSTRNRATCCAIIDLDHFKEINDRYGHAIGDEVLIGFAIRVRRAVRPTDIVTRIGGEEFAVIMHYLEPAQYRPEIFDRILSGIGGRPIHTTAGDIAITASIGVCCFTADDIPCNRESLLKCADAKLYRAKQEGRNRVVHY
jgi:diguanylate cyclase (GGDEF)-like protein